jgi:hypothetical protein
MKEIIKKQRLDHQVVRKIEAQIRFKKIQKSKPFSVMLQIMLNSNVRKLLLIFGTNPRLQNINQDKQICSF